MNGEQQAEHLRKFGRTYEEVEEQALSFTNHYPTCVDCGHDWGQHLEEVCILKGESDD